MITEEKCKHESFIAIDRVQAVIFLPSRISSAKKKGFTRDSSAGEIEGRVKSAEEECKQQQDEN